MIAHGAPTDSWRWTTFCGDTYVHTEYSVHIYIRTYYIHVHRYLMYVLHVLRTPLL